MDQIAGQVKRIGNSAANLKTKETEITILEIGNQVLRGVKVDLGLENILSDGLNSSDETKLWLAGGKVMAVQVGNGVRYFSALPKGTWVSFLLIWIFTIGLALALSSGLKNSWPALILIPLWPVSFYLKAKKYFDASAEGGQKV